MIAKFDFVETDGFVPEWFSLDGDEGAYSEEFLRLEYKSKNFLMNMGAIFIAAQVIVMLILLSLVLMVIRLCSDSANKCSRYLNGKLYWNLIFRVFIELSLELSIIASLDLKVHNWGESWGYIFSSVLSIISLTVLVVMIGFMRFWVRSNYVLMKETSMQKKIGSLYQGLNLKSKADALSFTEWFIARRIMYAATALFAQD